MFSWIGRVIHLCTLGLILFYMSFSLYCSFYLVLLHIGNFWLYSYTILFFLGCSSVTSIEGDHFIFISRSWNSWMALGPNPPSQWPIPSYTILKFLSSPIKIPSVPSLCSPLNADTLDCCCSWNSVGDIRHFATLYNHSTSFFSNLGLFLKNHSDVLCTTWLKTSIFSCLRILCSCIFYFFLLLQLIVIVFVYYSIY